MSTSYTTLPTGPLPYTAMDYAALRAEGIALLGALNGGQWTDFNTHDPGITLLEQICYAMTDLGYRANFPMADLLADSTDPGLPGPHLALPCDPVTPTDLRKAVLDLGVGAVDLRRADGPGIHVYYHPSSNQIRLSADPGLPEQTPVPFQGLGELLVQPSDTLSGNEAFAAVAQRVHRGRLAGEDVVIGTLRTYDVWIGASIELRAVDDPVEVLADIQEAIQEYLAPPTRFYAREELPDRSLDALYEGPLLDHGFILELPEIRREIYGSDLLHIIMDVVGVRAVRSLVMSSSSTGTRETWVLDIPEDSVARLASDSSIVLLRAGLPLKIDPAQLDARLAERAQSAALQVQDPPEPPRGRSRNLARTRSIQRQLPAAYGVGTLGLPATASADRKAQARQLQAYLLIFDQLLANGLAQLANAHRLLSPDVGSTRSYFGQPVEDPPLDIAALLRQPPDAFRAWLDAAVEPGDPVPRRNRFLAHLLARFGEQLGDHVRIGADAPDSPEAQILAERQAFLADVARMGRARGSGYNLLSGEEGGLEARLRVKLGGAEVRRFLFIEHILLRPVPEDSAQVVDEGDEQVPLLDAVDIGDPWSLQVSVVFQDQTASPEFQDFETFVVQTLAEELPAHLSPRLLWFGAADGVDHWSLLNSAWTAFRAALAAYRQAQVAGDSTGGLVQLRLRDARDRVIDLLGFGHTWPLRDIPHDEYIVVGPGESTTVDLAFSQVGVRYALCMEDSGSVVLLDGRPITADGTGGPLALPTPPVDVDVSYRILATKVDEDGVEGSRWVWLSKNVRVAEGVDSRLTAQIRLPLLDTTRDVAQPSDARIADYGVAVEVEILDSQEGVVYELIDDADAAKDFDAQTPISASMVGTSGTIVLTYPQTTEDLDLRVRGSKLVGDPQAGERRTATLDVVMPLRVRAKLSAAVALTASIVDYNGAGSVEVRTSQKSASYRAWSKGIRDSEFDFSDNPDPTVLVVLDDQRKIQVVRPTTDADLGAAGFTASGDAKVGNSQKITLAAGNFVRDTYLCVLATKDHYVLPLRSSDERTISTTVQLSQATALFVRPNPLPTLMLQVRLAGGQTVGDWRLLGGEPGVYHRLVYLSQFRGLPVYVHQRDDTDASQNKGLGQLRVQRDLALVADAPITDTRARQAPPTPSVVMDPAPEGTSVLITAVRAMSGLTQNLNGAGVLAAPVVSADPAQVAAGGSASIVITATEGSVYTLLRDGVVVQSATAEASGELRLDTGPLSATTTFEVSMVTNGPIAMDTRVQVVVSV